MMLTTDSTVKVVIIGFRSPVRGPDHPTVLVSSSWEHCNRTGGQNYEYKAYTLMNWNYTERI